MSTDRPADPRPVPRVGPSALTAGAPPLAAAGAPRAWCRATVRATRAVPELDAHLHAVCAPPPEPPTVLPGPLLGRSLRECLDGALAGREDGAGAATGDPGGHRTDEYARRGSTPGRPDPASRPGTPRHPRTAPDPARPEPGRPGGRAPHAPAPHGPREPAADGGRGTPSGAGGRRRPPPLPDDGCPPIARLRELAGADPADAARRTVRRVHRHGTSTAAMTGQEAAAEEFLRGATDRVARRLGATGPTDLDRVPVRTPAPAGADALLRRALTHPAARGGADH
ncbi:MAG: hypothetical protein ACYC3U_10575, partial [Georgenia sp.]